MKYKGKNSIWAYGKGGKNGSFPIVIVPYQAIFKEAEHAKEYVMQQTIKSLATTGGIMLIVIIMVFAVAFISSKSVTEPIRVLAHAAKNLSAGNFETKVNIKSTDEFSELGKIFNDVGPKLKERESIKRSLAVAMDIQQHLLPQKPPDFDGFDIAGESVYCEETGGDYFDFIELLEIGHGKMGIAVGDVSGHGVGAALLMASARAVLRSNAARYHSNLSALFESLNFHLVRDTGGAQFITLFYGIIDNKDSSVTWTSAGHDPALCLKQRNGNLISLENTGMPLGIMDNAKYDQAGPVILDSDDIILIGTDGIWETTNESGEMFGKTRLENILKKNSGKNANQIYQSIINAVQIFRGNLPQRDDITLVVIKAK